jgi:putative flavoprotein involved in K+ transport
VLLEASDQPAGSWPHYYDSLTLFSPARYSALPGLPFGGDPDRYPRRDEVVAYLLRYATTLDLDIRTRARVTQVTADGPGFAVHLADTSVLSTRTVVAATGGFSRPHRPALPGLDRFAGTVLHASDYRDPGPYQGQRIVVVGAGNSAIQIAAELATTAHVTLATRRPVRFAPQRPLGRDVHAWLNATGLDVLPVGRWLRRPPTTAVLDTGRYRAAVRAGRPDRRPLFTDAHDTTLTWPDGTTEHVDTMLLATGYQPDVGYLATLGALDPAGRPRQTAGMSTSHLGLAYVGLDWQRSLSSATLRGVGRDAQYVAERLRTLLATRPRNLAARVVNPRGH